VRARAALFILVPLAILLLPFGVFVADSAAAGGRIPRNVSVGGVAIGGLTPDDARLTLEAHVARLRAEQATFTVDGSDFVATADDVGFTVDIDAAIDAAMRQRAADGMVDRFGAWISGFRDPIDLALPATFDDDAVDALLGEWEEQAIEDPADPGSITLDGMEVVTHYPKPGRAIDRDVATGIVEGTIETIDTTAATLPVVDRRPRTTSADIDAAAARVASIIDGPVTLRSDETGFLITFTSEQIADAVRVTVADDPPAITIDLDQDVIGAILEPRRPEFEVEPVDAAFNVDLETNEVSIIPGKNGTRLDLPGVVAALLDAAEGSGFGPFPLDTGAEPDFTTADAEAAGDLELVSEFTTKHPAGEARVINIQRMADEVDGAIVRPGETFSINDYVGERTVEDGYVAAPAIIGGVPYCCDHPANIGGGVSQFATTFFNAVFYGCYEDVEHTPHSLWFSRYPMGREATLGFPAPDVKFRNNTDTIVLIKTQYTSRSITVKFFGNNGGKTCTDETSDRHDIVPFDEVLVADDTGELHPGEQKVRKGKEGFTVLVTRIIEYPDGRIVREEPFRWRYRKLDQQITVHPCEVTGEPVDCPVQLPRLVGTAYEDAFHTLDGLGLIVVKVEVPTDSQNEDGVIVEMTPPAGEWVELGSSVTVKVAVYDSGDDA